MPRNYKKEHKNAYNQKHRYNYDTFSSTKTARKKNPRS
jgi:hypothetical protein